MLAKDIMTTRVITVLDETPVEEVARTLLKWRISAVPVVDIKDRIVGIVSEGDLMFRAEPGSDSKDSGLASGHLEPGERAQRYAKRRGHLAKDVMTTAVITADEDDTLGNLAATLEEHRIKRVPILKQGRLVGIVSRANLLHGLAALPGIPTVAPTKPAPPARLGSNDHVTRAAILNTLHNEFDLNGIVNVIVTEGIVDLWGGVETETQRQAIRVVAENAPNVTAVNDHLTVLNASHRRLLGR